MWGRERGTRDRRELRTVDGQRRNLAQGGGARRELPYPFDLALAEGEVQPAEVGPQGVRVERLPPGGRLGDLVELVKAQVTRAQEGLVHVLHQPGMRRGEGAPHRTDGEDHRRAGPL